MHGLNLRRAAPPSSAFPHRPLRSPSLAGQFQRRLHPRWVPPSGASTSNGSSSRTAVETLEQGVATPAPNALASASARSTETTAAGSRTKVEPGSQAAGSAFTWTRHWWPLVPEAYLLTDRPNAITLLGIPLVVWLDKTTGNTTTAGGTWRVFRDRCPHRLAPLSEGRVEADGSLSCSYHGWRFDGSGACRRIPQAVDTTAEAAACASRRSCVTSFPARLEAGMLWAWLVESPDTAEEAAATPLLMSNDIRDRERRYHDHVSRTAAGEKPAGPAPYPVVWFMRDLPYSYEVLMENLTDPAHLPHSHHGVTPVLNRYKDAAMPMRRVQRDAGASVTAASPAAPATRPGPTVPLHWARHSGPDFEYDFVGSLAPDATISVTMPYSVLYTYRKPQFETRTELLAVPVAPGRSRLFTIRQALAPPPAPSLIQLLTNPRRHLPALVTRLDPVVPYHVSLNEVLDGDSVFLAAQDEQLQEVEAAETAEAEAAVAGAGGKSMVTSGQDTHAGFWSRLYYLPAQSDGAVLSTRKWLEERAGGGPFRATQRRRLAAPVAGSAAGPPLDASLGRPRVSKVPGEAPSPQERVRRLDRYEQHTRHCPDCRARLQLLQGLAAVARNVQTVAVLGMCIAGGALGTAAGMAVATAAAGSAAAATATAAATTTVAPFLAPGALLAALAAVWALAKWFAAVSDRSARVFQFKDYVHAERD